MSATEAATEAVAEVAEEVADQATNVAEVSRGLSGRDVGLVFGGIVVGAGLGAAATYFILGRRLETKYSEIAAEEVAQMREHYNQKAVALEAEVGKGDLAEIVRERGYVPPEDDEESAPPMAVAPPAPVVEAVKEDEEAEIPPPAEADSEPEVRNIFQTHAEPEEDEDEWDWAKERSLRTPLKPYVIHIEERDEHDAYDGVTFTYYEQDDVVCDERDEVIDERKREELIGEDNLSKFGHGSGSPSVVYVRNNQLEMDIEVVKSPNSYAEEVHGFEPPELRHSDRRRGRVKFDDD